MNANAVECNMATGQQETLHSHSIGGSPWAAQKLRGHSVTDLGLQYRNQPLGPQDQKQQKSDDPIYIHLLYGVESAVMWKDNS